MKNLICLIVACLLLPCHLLFASIITVEIDNLNGISQDVAINNSAPAVDSTFLTFSQTGVTSPAFPETFDFDLILTPVAGVTDLTSATNLAGNIANSTSSNRFDGGDQISVTVANISNPNVVFDGIRGVGLNFAGADAIGFSVDIDGTPTDFVFGGPLDPRFGATPGNDAAGDPILLSNGSVLTFLSGTDVNGLSGTLRGLNLQFSSIPEPVSLTTLIALIALPFLSRRRRALS